VWAAKRAALEIIRAVPLSPGRQAEFDSFLGRDRKATEDWATWCAIAEVHGPDWRSWPAALADPGSAPVAELRRARADRVELPRLAAVADSGAGGRGAAGGPAGRHGHRRHRRPGGRRASGRCRRLGPAGRDRAGISVGAPPDEFNQRGQDWTLPPWHPGRLAAQAGRPMGDLVAATTRNAGGMRMDHVMALARLWWIPAGMPPGPGHLRAV
jgi:4-alpha-glucanotransferase